MARDRHLVTDSNGGEEDEGTAAPMFFRVAPAGEVARLMLRAVRPTTSFASCVVNRRRKEAIELLRDAFWKATMIRDESVYSFFTRIYRILRF